MSRQTYRRGAYVMDARTGQVGEVMGHEGPNVQLRPLHGGQEWEADPCKVRLATNSEKRAAGITRERP